MSPFSSRIAFALKSLVPAAVASLLIACGPPPAEAFAGLYDVDGTATMTIQLPDGPRTLTGNIQDSITVIEGSDSDLIVRLGSCNVPFNVDDYETALVQRGGSCVTMDGNTKVTMTFNSGSILRTTDRVSQMTLSADLDAVIDGATYPGTYKTNQTWTKTSK